MTPKFCKGKAYVLSRHQKTNCDMSQELYKLFSLLEKRVRDVLTSSRRILDSLTVSVLQRSNKI